VFCDSEFWHGFDWENRQRDFHSNRTFWLPKIERTMARDVEVTKLLRSRGWLVLRFWGREIEKDLQSCVQKVTRAVAKRSSRFSRRGRVA
jgi:DNA mismatch endonuclease (patch repair protein)